MTVFNKLSPADMGLQSRLRQLDKNRLTEWEANFIWSLTSSKRPFTLKQRQSAEKILARFAVVAKPAPSGKTVYCANCHGANVDRGTRQTCEHCGCSPVPSYSYEKDSGFYPVERRLHADRLYLQPDFLEQMEKRKKRTKIK